MSTLLNYLVGLRLSIVRVSGLVELYIISVGHCVHLTAYNPIVGTFVELGVSDFRRNNEETMHRHYG